MNHKKNVVLVSACLAGLCCRYDGIMAENKETMALLKAGMALPVCPEQLGGLPTPREPSEIEPGYSGEDVLAGRARVLTASGKDVTEAYVRGAEECLKLCKTAGIAGAILKAKSPSCGCGVIHTGQFDGALGPGYGVTAALLKLNGIAVEAK